MDDCECYGVDDCGRHDSVDLGKFNLGKFQIWLPRVSLVGVVLL